MRIRVKLFAMLRERCGTEEVKLDLPEAATVAAAFDKIRETLPAVAPLLVSAAAAVNRRYARPDASLRDGDELALIPPVSGG